MTFRDLVANVSSHPKVYEFQRLVLGGRNLDKRLVPVINRTCDSRLPGVVVDLGGGTARTRDLWPKDWTYYSIDPDDRMTQLDAPDSDINRVVGSAGALPFPDDFADIVFMKDTSHHLDDETWVNSLDEINRVLKDSGRFIFLDAVFNPSRLFSVAFWKLDNGKWPRSSAELEEEIRSHFKVIEIERFSLIHNVILVTSEKS